MTRIVLIRHAEAEGNLYRRVHGQFDANITMLGRRQVAALAERFRDAKIDGLWSSDLTRTQSTASAVLKYHPELTMHLAEGLREVDVGVWEDTPWGEIARTYPEQYRNFNQDPERWSVPGGEDFNALVERMGRTLLDLAAAYPGGTVAAVSHAYAIRALASRLMGVKFADIAFGDNTAVTTIIAEDGKLTLEQYADGSHLGELSTFAHQGLAHDHKGKKADGWFAPMALPEEEALYTRAYSETWLASHGNLNGFAPALYLGSAAQRVRQDPACLVKIYYGEDLAGLLELDPERGSDDNAGWISLLWVEEHMRGRRFGAQLIGQAVSYFRKKNRGRLRLHVSRTNAAAIGFYEAMGFEKIGTAEGVGGQLYLMQMDITRRVWRLP